VVCFAYRIVPAARLFNEYPIWVLALVFGLIAVRKAGHFTIKIRQAMVGGAAIVLVTGQVLVSSGYLYIWVPLVWPFQIGTWLSYRRLIQCRFSSAFRRSIELNQFDDLRVMVILLV
jgi:hypothetical protein